MRNGNAIKISLKRRKEKQKQKYALGKMSKQQKKATQKFIKFLCKSCEIFEKAHGVADPRQKKRKTKI